MKYKTHMTKMTLKQRVDTSNLISAGKEIKESSSPNGHDIVYQEKQRCTFLHNIKFQHTYRELQFNELKLGLWSTRHILRSTWFL